MLELAAADDQAVPACEREMVCNCTKGIRRRANSRTASGYQFAQATAEHTCVPCDICGDADPACELVAYGVYRHTECYRKLFGGTPVAEGALGGEHTAISCGDRDTRIHLFTYMSGCKPNACLEVTISYANECEKKYTWKCECDRLMRKADGYIYSVEDSQCAITACNMYHLLHGIHSKYDNLFNYLPIAK